MKLFGFNIPSHFFVAGSAWVSRIVMAMVQFASIRILIDILGLEQYSAFTLLTGIAGWFLLADLCVGVSLQNYISEARAQKKAYDEWIITAGIIVVVLMIIAITSLYLISPYVAPYFLKQYVFLNDEKKSELFFLVGGLSVAGGIGNIICNVWYAEHKGYLANIVPALASVLGLAGLFYLKGVPLVERLYVCLAVFSAPSAVLLLFGLAWRIYYHAARTSGVQAIEIARKLLKRGYRFWLFGILSLGVVKVDYVIMSQFLNAHEIVVYSISTKVFGLSFFLYSSILYALWPVMTEKIADGKWYEVGQYIKRYLFLGFAVTFVSTILLIWLMPVAVDLLAPKSSVVVPNGFIYLLGTYQMILVWTGIFAMILHSMSELKVFWIPTFFQALISVCAQWILVPIMGLYGIVIGLIFSFLITVSWALPLAVKRHYQLGIRIKA